MSNVETIGSLGENESLKRTIARLNLSEHALVGPGDDSAVINAPDGRFVVTTDTLVEDHDFKLSWSTQSRSNNQRQLQEGEKIAWPKLQ